MFCIFSLYVLPHKNQKGIKLHYTLSPNLSFSFSSVNQSVDAHTGHISMVASAVWTGFPLFSLSFCLMGRTESKSGRSKLLAAKEKLQF